MGFHDCTADDVYKNVSKCLNTASTEPTFRTAFLGALVAVEVSVRKFFRRLSSPGVSSGLRFSTGSIKMFRLLRYDDFDHGCRYISFR
jgi:hypothetical protein